MKRMLALLLACALLCAPALAFRDDADIGAAYCEAVNAMAERGVLAGYDDGAYHPADTLTREQGAKMLLCALGLSRAGNYANVGAKWFQTVREDARRERLYDGDAAMESDQAITRAQAALLGWNGSRAKDAATPAPSGSGGGSNGSGGSGGGSSAQTPAPPETGVGEYELPAVWFLN